MPTSDYVFPSEIRDLIANALPEDTSLHGRGPELRHTYLPDAHLKALRPSNMLVVGIRGSGKSFWWAALQQEDHRAAFGDRVGINEQTKVSTGFGETPSPNRYPGKDVIKELSQKFDARMIWKTVVLHHVGDRNLPSVFTTLEKWGKRVNWVKNHPEEVERYLFDADTALDNAGRFHLVLFDALDRSADDWQTMHALTRGLLQNLLEFRSYKRIRLKIFVRPDQIEDSTVGAFPDSSKVLSQKTELFWPRHELYGLLWQYLANGIDGETFRNGCKNIVTIQWDREENVWIIPDILRNSEEEQRLVFHAITGPWMGKDRRRGFPYTWLVNHLGDARMEVSPRSFLAALRHAALDTPRPGHKYALHYESIKRGVQEASKIRVREVQEDYPWVQNLMAPLEGRITVPCSFNEIEQIWNQGTLLKQLEKDIQQTAVRLPPAHIKDGAVGVFQDLMALGLVEEISGGRINLPDVYRVGYGIGRRGGVRPVAQKRSTR